MRGDDEHQSAMFSYISTDQRVPTDHPLRPTRSMVDEALRQLFHRFRELYTSNGRAVDCARGSRTEGYSVSQDDFSTGSHNLMGITHSFSTGLVVIPLASSTIERHK